MKASILQRALHKNRSAIRFIDKVREVYALKPLAKYRVIRSYYDSFDWRLYRNNMVLEHDRDHQDRWAICPAAGTGPSLAQAVQGAPVFLDDLAPGPFRELLAPVLGVRALRKLISITVAVQSYELRDARDKILLRMDRENYLVTGQAGSTRSALVNIRLHPYRGYEKTAHRLLGLLDNLEPAGDPRQGPLYFLLEQSGRRVLDYSSKLKIPLRADQTMGQALVTLLLFLLDILERNIDGIRADTDTEFLHDFRIAGRRSRSLITQVKNIFPSFDEQPFKQAFSQLSVRTSENRDLDVFLQDIPRNSALLPAAVQQDLEPLYAYLRKARADSRETLLQWLNSAAFTGFLVQWREFLTHCVSNDLFEQNGKIPVLEVADHSIWKIYKRLIRQGKAVNAAGSFESLHEVRKTAKKLRYLLESFRSLYPQDQIEQVIQQLKRLQNLLGAIVDYHVQQMYLSRWSAAAAGSGFTVAANEAAKSLISSFNELENNSCRKFESRFAEFSSKRNTNRFRLLFKQEDD